MLRERNAARLVSQAEAAASAKPFDVVTQIDLAPLLGESAEAMAATAQQIRHACLEVGFFYVTSHGVDPELVARTFDAAKTFFELPQEQKEAISILNSAKMRGYTGLLEENTDPDATCTRDSIWGSIWQKTIPMPTPTCTGGVSTSGLTSTVDERPARYEPVGAYVEALMRKAYGTTN